MSSKEFLPLQVTGELAEFFRQDLSRPATREVEVIRNLLKSRELRAMEVRTQDEHE
ncbi:hypothetical protein JJB07_01020 [Tumebacillus sp. ITR2]|uniref:Uncharacterized protein n=1 Tax=Tumebacillus amylolyticus TaxID=2801339 RepID=A0ABS1J4K7_9BACL|nr:hypothetical protein [Tumebacillus amylolyticus]MBL0385212.1 hypothetical protein [Tumebacillus amylolyticus]